MRAVTGYVELSRNGRWAMIAAVLTKGVSERLDPKLRDVAPDLNQAMRRRVGTDRLDGDQIFSALNGMFLLATIRDSRDSLALNALFDQVWTQTGQALEIHIERNLQQLRNNAGDAIASARLDAALKMAEVRFNQEYADTLRRAKVGRAPRQLAMRAGDGPASVSTTNRSVLRSAALSMRATPPIGRGFDDDANGRERIGPGRVGVDQRADLEAAP